MLQPKILTRRFGLSKPCRQVVRAESWLVLGVCVTGSCRHWESAERHLLGPDWEKVCQNSNSIVDQSQRVGEEVNVDTK
jgi:hypothetical protein